MSYLKNRIRHEIKFILVHLKMRYYDKISREYDVKLPIYKVRKILKKHDLYFDRNGTPSWWFNSLMIRRNSADDITREFFKYAKANIPKDANILITGCGTGWMLFWFVQQGFTRLHGFDYLQNVVDSANEIGDLINIKTNIWTDDGFKPNLKEEKYDMITALFWVFSAWKGNYGNESHASKNNLDLLKEFFSIYIPHLSDNGYLVVELIDAVAEFQVPAVEGYPIRHTMAEVTQCAEELGLSVEKKMFTGRHRRQPKMLYVMKKAV